MAARPLPIIGPRTLTVVGLGMAALVGVLMSRSVGAGVGATIAVLYATLALLNLPLAITAWVPIIFLSELPLVWIGPSAASAVVLFAWLGALRSGQAGRTAVTIEQRRLLMALAGYVIWVTLSILWAGDPSRSEADVYVWYVCALVVVIIMTTVTTPQLTRWLLIAYVVGAVISVGVGLILTGLAPAQSALSSAAQVDGRLGGGSGDPNYLAAGLVPAIVIAASLVAVIKSALARWGLTVSIVILIIGLAASESRGGLLAAGAAALAAVVVFKRYRRQVLFGLLTVATIAAVAFASSPGAWQRVSNFNGGGTGRSDLWKVAERVWEAHPVQGVGLSNFEIQEARFVRLPGQLTSVQLISDVPHVAHNMYLQTLAELGVVGLLALLSVLLACMRATWRAGHELDCAGAGDLATLARALLVAQVGVLVALFFISDGADERFWVLFGLGPVMLALSRAPETRQQRPASL